MSTRLIDLTGQTFGRLTVLERAANRGKHSAWRARCTCGQERTVHGTALRNGLTSSCGCAGRGPVPMVQPDNVTRTIRLPKYVSVHARLRNRRGNAREHPCTDCGQQAQEWSYEGGADVEGVEIRNGIPRRYSPDLEAYAPRCIRCHRAKDLGEAVRARRARRARRAA